MAQTKTKKADQAAETHDHGHDDHGDQHFLSKYVFSSDHKIIGIQYGITGLVFLLIGFCLIATMRWQMAKPGQPIPVAGKVLEHVYAHELGGESKPIFENGVMSRSAYNQFGAMHGVIMVFLAIVPLGFAAFGNYIVPLQIGAVDMCFPRVNMASFWCFFVGVVIIAASFFIPGGPAQAGWTMYPPLSEIIPTNGQIYLLVGFILLITSSLLGAVNFIATIIQLRAPGMTWFRMPFFVWAQFVTAFLLLLAFPPLEAAAIMMLIDIVAPGASFFSPTGLMVAGAPADISGGGSPLLYQHLFWFLGHPEVYVLILPAIGIVTEILANTTRRPIWGYKLMVGSVLVLGFLSFIVWAHHMYMTGMSTKVATFFQTTTMIISIPSVILLTCLFMSLWKGSMRFNTASMFALAFLPMFGIGGLTGLPLGFNFTDIHLHDTYYVIAHFHYVVAPGTIFGLLAGIYYWYPKMTGRHMNEFWGKVHFWCSLIFMNLIFMPMFAQGMDGMIRRMSDGGAAYGAADGVVGLTTTSLALNQNISHAAWALGLAQIPFIINFFWSLLHGEKVKNDNPVEGTTLEWQTPTPPGHGNFTKKIEVYRDAYEYSVPGASKDFSPQNEPAK
ncbi:MAG: cytochrome C oxidase subunit I [Verrucomicrobiales bacterium]|nr:cytochrome C oxidase subunit I [Verrucomicrobiales bacterium]|tara:strand:+ start:5446 stop:7287 length:1842 start_codon:yes stop_codon:yes gene_type:complete